MFGYPIGFYAQQVIEEMERNMYEEQLADMQRQITALKTELSATKDEVQELKHSTSISVATNEYEYRRNGLVPYYRYENVNVNDAILDVMDHVGLSYDYDKGKKGSVFLKKLKKEGFCHRIYRLFVS